MILSDWEQYSVTYYSDCPANVAKSSIADSKVSIVGPSAAKFVDATQMFGATVGEDCLKLNIWNKHGGEKAKAVLFWLYGGGLPTSSQPYIWARLIV